MNPHDVGEMTAAEEAWYEEWQAKAQDISFEEYMEELAYDARERLEEFRADF